MRTAILLLVTLALAVNLAAGAKRRKFCPKEEDGDRCKAKESQYKCGVFFKELTKRADLTYIGSLPDALTEDNKNSWADILGPNVKKDSFDEFDCEDGKSEKRANSRCYSILNKLANTDLDGCEDSLFNQGEGSATMGDALCDQLFRFLRPIKQRKTELEEEGIKNQTITFQYSQCGIDWKTVGSDEAPLTAKHKVCCHPKFHTRSMKYYRCDAPDETQYQTC